jgi:hypothetical protein
MTDIDAPLSFARDVRSMFTDTDVDHMHNMMDLADRDSVFENADAIYAVVSNGTMPPPSSGEPRWTAQMCQTFKRWKDEGGKP